MGDEKLLKISEWDHKKREREFTKFVEWLDKKYNLDYPFPTYIQEYIYSILLIQFNKKTAFNFVKDLDVNKMSIEFFYKCLRRIAKLSYERSEQSEKETLKQSIKDTIRSTLKTVVSLENIIKLINIYNEDSDNSSLVSYTFSEFGESESKSKPGIITEDKKEHKREDVEIKLPYIENINSIESEKVNSSIDETNIKKIKLIHY